MKGWILPVGLIICMNSVAEVNKAATSSELRKHNDDYYSNDLETAVEEARNRTHHYDYSNSLRYERTTSQSIRFTRLANDDLEETTIETPSLGATAAGKPEEIKPDGKEAKGGPDTDQDQGIILSDRLRSSTFVPIDSGPKQDVLRPGLTVTVQSR